MGDFWIEDSEDHLTPSGVEVASRLVPEGTVLLLARGMTLHKRVPICRVAKPSTFNQDVKAVLPRQGISARFLPYLLVGNHDRLHERVDSAGHGTGRLNTDALLSLPVVVPNKAEQESIAELGEAIDGRLQLLRQTNATLESIAQALFKSWFIDFDPVRAKAEGREPEGMDTATAALFPSEFEEPALGGAPKGWRVEPLSAWLTVLETGRRPKGGVGNIEYGVPSIGAESIVRVGQFDFAKTKYVSEDFFAQMKSGVLQSCDVLLYKDGGKPGIFLPRVSMFGDGFPFDRCAINEHVFRLRVKEPLGQVYLYFWIWSDCVMHELKHRGGKAAIPGINQADVREQNLLVPSKQVATAFNSISEPLFSKIFSNAKKIKVLSELRDILLPRLISGKLRLPEAQEHVEDALA